MVSSSIWLLQIQYHDNFNATDKIVTTLGAPSYFIAEYWGKRITNFYNGNDKKLIEPNATTFEPDIYMIRHQLYSYCIKLHKGEWCGHNSA